VAIWNGPPFSENHKTFCCDECDMMVCKDGTHWFGPFKYVKVCIVPAAGAVVLKSCLLGC
jgi:hypothetical protein